MDRTEIYRELCENAHDLIQSVGPDGRFLYVNRAWLQALGYSESDITGMRILDVVHPRSRDHCIRVFNAVVAGRSPGDLAASFVTRDGGEILVEGNVHGHVEADKTVATLAILRDVTDRASAQDQLDRLFQVSLDMMCIAGMDGFFKQVNPAFERILGYTREELLSRRFLEFVHQDDRDETVRQMGVLEQGQTVVDFRNRYRAQNGTYHWLSWRAAPTTTDGLVYAVARDITWQRRQEEQLRSQARELERSNTDLEQFAYVASHDLRAPLRALANLAEFIAEDLADGRTEKLGEHLDGLKERVARMDRLIEDLLQYSRAGRDTLAPQPVDTAEVVRETVSWLEPPDGFTFDIDPSMPTIVTTRPPFEQVMRNLLANAVRHHDRTDGRVRVSATDSGDRVEFEVTDDGPGIPDESADEVFELFHRLSGDGTGTGLGLALVKRLVETHGGRVRLVPSEGRGATFRFTWPRREQAPHDARSGVG